MDSYNMNDKVILAALKKIYYTCENLFKEFIWNLYITLKKSNYLLNIMNDFGREAGENACINKTYTKTKLI